MLVFTGFSRNASEIAEEQIRTTGQKTELLSRMMGMVDEAVNILTQGDNINDFGKLLHEGWQLKRELTRKITTSQIDEIYETARKAGAVGGKLLGAGGGGFMLFFAAPDVQPRIREALKGLLHVPFRFENLGTQIIFYDPNGSST